MPYGGPSIEQYIMKWLIHLMKFNIRLYFSQITKTCLKHKNNPSIFSILKKGGRDSC